MAKAKVPASELVRLALLNVAGASGEVKLSGKGGVFATTTGGNKDAIEECLNKEKPLLTIVRTDGKSQFVALAPAGFERIAAEIPEEKAAALAKAVAAPLKASERIGFIQDVIRRTPLAAAELTPLLEEAVAAEKAEAEARIKAAAERKAAEEAAKKALDRAKQLLEERRQNRLDALKREWEAEGANANELRPHKIAAERPPTAKEPATAPKLKTNEETDFRRYECDRLAAAWRDAWDAKKEEGCEYLEAAMWNIRGFRMVGEVGATVEFDGHRHESDTPVLSGTVTIVRPGWLLKEDEGEYIALKAAVTKA